MKKINRSIDGAENTRDFSMKCFLSFFADAIFEMGAQGIFLSKAVALIASLNNCP